MGGRRLLSCGIVLTSQIAFVCGSSNPPYNAYNYDLSTPQFTPDGRLMQVEYASRSPELGDPLVAVPVLAPREDEDSLKGVPTVVLATLSRSSGMSRRKRDEGGAGVGGAANNLGGTTRKRRGQSRLVSLPLTPNTSAPISAPSVVLGLSGVLADATSLLRTARDDLTAYRRTYGLGKLHATLPIQGDASLDWGRTVSAQNAPTVVAKRLARAIGDKCQSHSFGGGIRPYGASVLICGVDESGVCLCVTQPSGAVVVNRFGVNQFRPPLDEKDGDKRHGVIVIGGDITMQTKIEELLWTRLEDSRSADAPMRYALRTAVTSVVGALLHAYSSADPSKEGGIPLIEVVICRPDGSYRLSEFQVESMIEQEMHGR